MKFIWLFITSFLPLHLFSQSLTIDETVNYLNKLSSENPEISHDPNKGDKPREWECETIKNSYTFKLDKSGSMTVNLTTSWYNCKEQKNEKQSKTQLFAQFLIEDIDMENIETYNKYGGSETGFILKTIDNYNNISSRFMDIDTKNSQVLFSTSDHYNKMRFYNAMKYLILSALENGYKRNDKTDPFVEKTANPNPSIKKDENPEYKIPLKETNGVFTLSVNVGGQLISFILDSGAGESNISSDTENKLLIKGFINQKDYLINGLYRLADGSIVECKRVKLPKVSVGSKTIYNVVASISPGNSPNLLGQSFLNKTNSWTIDNLKSVLIIK
jgi:clan AA aspartic protease (TIGR02281 family)